MKPSTSVAIFALALALLIPSPASAGMLFNFTYNDGTIAVAGTLNANPNGDGTFTAVASNASIVGGPDTGPLTFVTNPNAPGIGFFLGQGVYDDQLRPASNPTIDASGLLYQFQNGDYLNIYGLADGTYSAIEMNANLQFVYSDANNRGQYFTLTAASTVPEPSSLAMLGLAGLLGATVTAIKRRRPSID